jgi:hypothetical protein
MMLKKEVFLFVIGLATSSLFAQNIFTSGFETNFIDWNLYVNTDSGAVATAAIDSVNAYEGKNCLAVTVTAVPTSNSNNWHIQVQDPAWLAQKDVIYRFSCWAKADSSGRSIHIAAQGDSTSKYTYRAGIDMLLDTDWKYCEFSRTCDFSGPDSMNFYIYCGTSVGTYYFDSMALDSVGIIADESDVRQLKSSSKVNQMSNFNIQQLPGSIRFDLKNSTAVSRIVTIHSLDGRLFSSQNIPTASQSFEIRKPVSGSWVVGVNQNKKVILIP